MRGKSVQASMLIRSPPRVVFDAFVMPESLRKFWLDDASAPLAPGAKVTWRFMVPGVSASLTVTAFEPGQRLAFRWDDGTDVDVRFEAIDDGTRVSVTCGGFDEHDLLAQATTTIEGYAIVLCDLKTLLEAGHSANLVRDKAQLIARSRA